MAETKHDKFVRLAESRVNNAIKQIEVIGNLSNRSNYEYSAEEVQAIVKRLKRSVIDLEKMFDQSSRTDKFKL